MPGAADCFRSAILASRSVIGRSKSSGVIIISA
jgi:hypothetical protein